MKSLPFVLLFSFMIFSASRQQVKIGAKAGLNFSEWNTDDPYKSDIVTGFHFGPTVRLKASDIITIESALLLSQKGTRWNRIIDWEDENGSLFADTKWKYKFLYLEIPVLVRFQVFPGLEFYLGPQFSYLIKTSSIMNDYWIYDNEREYSQEIEEKGLKGYNTFDIALSGGIGYLFNNGVNVNVGYDYGFYTLNDEGTEGKYYNRVIKISFGYYF